jgi:LDH2 family malate/lactate/ureidoglycolate dehydrogenase
MIIRHWFSGAALAAAIVLTVIGMFKGAGILVALATLIELVAAALTGKQTNV